MRLARAEPLLLAALTACYDPKLPGLAPDAAGPPPDGIAVADAPRLDAGGLGPFGTPQVVPLGGTFDDPFLVNDEMEIFVEQQQGLDGPGSLLLTARRGSGSASWPALEPIELVPTSPFQGSPALSPDGLTMYFGRSATGLLDVAVTTRPDPNGPWASPLDVPDLSSLATDLPGGVALDGTVVYLTSGRGGTRDIFRAVNSSGDWVIAPVPGLALPDRDETDPHPMPDDMALYFASEIPGADRRLFVVRRPGPGMPFGAPNPLSELDIGLSQSDPWVSRDERVIYFRSGFSIYRASR